VEHVSRLFIEELEHRTATSPMIVHDGPPDPAVQAYLNADSHAPFQTPPVTTLALCEEANGPCYLDSAAPNTGVFGWGPEGSF